MEKNRRLGSVDGAKLQRDEETSLVSRRGGEGGEEEAVGLQRNECRLSSGHSGFHRVLLSCKVRNRVQVDLYSSECLATLFSWYVDAVGGTLYIRVCQS